jgi:hypothetical protein
MLNSSMAFSRRWRWCPLGVVVSVISGLFECSCRPRLRFGSTGVLKPSKIARQEMITMIVTPERDIEGLSLVTVPPAVEVDGAFWGDGSLNRPKINRRHVRPWL